MKTGWCRSEGIQKNFWTDIDWNFKAPKDYLVTMAKPERWIEVLTMNHLLKFSWIPSISPFWYIWAINSLNFWAYLLASSPTVSLDMRSLLSQVIPELSDMDSCASDTGLGLDNLGEILISLRYSVFIYKTHVIMYDLSIYHTGLLYKVCIRKCFVTIKCY